MQGLLAEKMTVVYSVRKRNPNPTNLQTKPMIGRGLGRICQDLAAKTILKRLILRINLD